MIRTYNDWRETKTDGLPMIGERILIARDRDGNGRLYVEQGVRTDERWVKVHGANVSVQSVRFWMQMPEAPALK